MPVQTTVKPMNIRNIKAGMLAARQYVQDEKIQISRTVITKNQYAEKWPEKYLSYVSRETRNNEYKDPDKFFRIMHNKPEWYLRRFIFRPIVDTQDQLIPALLRANRIIYFQSRKYGYRTGFYGSSFKISINGTTLTSLTNIGPLPQDSTARIINNAPYASTIESRAVYYNKIGGVMYYAAKIIQKEFKQLGVRFVYTQPQYEPRAIPDENGRWYAIPTLVIGPRTQVIEKLTRPGKNERGRRRAANKRRRAK